MEGRALPMVFSPSTCPLPLVFGPRTTGFVEDWLGIKESAALTTSVHFSRNENISLGSSEKVN